MDWYERQKFIERYKSDVSDFFKNIYVDMGKNQIIFFRLGKGKHILIMLLDIIKENKYNTVHPVFVDESMKDFSVLHNDQIMPNQNLGYLSDIIEYNRINISFVIDFQIKKVEYQLYNENRIVLPTMRFVGKDNPLIDELSDNVSSLEELLSQLNEKVNEMEKTIMYLPKGNEYQKAQKDFESKVCENPT